MFISIYGGSKYIQDTGRNRDLLQIDSSNNNQN